MTLFFNRVAFKTATTGTGTITVGDALSDAFLTPGEAGVGDDDSPIAYLISDGLDFEMGYGTYHEGTPNTFSRDTVTISKVSGTVGTSKLNLSGDAEVRFGLAAEDLNDFGTVKSVGISVPAGLQVSGSPITTSGTLTVTWQSGYQAYSTDEANKLAGIEAGADVTDATNVAAAGAIMASLLTNRGDIIYRGASSPSRLAKGTTGAVLTAGADDPEWIRYQMPAAVQKSGNQTSTSGTYAAISGMSITITPQSTANRIRIKAVINASIFSGVSSAQATGGFQLRRGTSTVLQEITLESWHGIDDVYNILVAVIDFVDEPSTASAVTYNLYFARPNGSEVVVLGGSGTYMHVEEIRGE